MTSEREDLAGVPVLVTDFDGTLTERDFYQLVRERLVPPSIPDYWGEYLADRLTHFEALQRIFASIVADESQLWETARLMRLDPRLPQAISRLQEAGWEIVVASAGCRWYIEQLLAEQRINVTVHANPGAFVPGHGLLMEYPEGSPYLDPSTGIDKSAVVHAAVQQHRIVAFAGDGRPDEAAAMLIPAERRYACGWLAGELQRKGVPFRPFKRWPEIVEMLLDGKAS